jgi:hypothetical protein
MSKAEAPSSTSRREMRKALIRLRLEMHRQEIRHETKNLVNPLTRLRGMSQNVQAGMGIKHAPLWGMAGVVLLGFLTGKGARRGGGGGLTRMVKLGTTLIPLIKLAMQPAARKR